MRRFPIRIASAVLVAAMLLGCDSRPRVPQVVVHTEPVDTSRLRPETLPYSRGTLVLAGQRLPVDVQLTSENGDVVLIMLLNGEEAEREEYEITSHAFRFRGSKGSTFDPPITLLELPTQRIPSETRWAGRVIEAQGTFGADATIRVTTDQLNVASLRGPLIKVDVALDIETPGAGQARRELKFWLEQNNGVVRREFGANSTREPADPGLDAEPR